MRNYTRSFAGTALIIVLSVLFCSSSFAQNDALFNDRDYCLSLPQECLTLSASALKDVPEYSLDWYRIKQNRLTAMYQLQLHDQLRPELAPLVTLDDAPPVFRTTVYTIHAKLLLIDGEKELGNEYVEKTVALIKAVNEVSIDPTRYAEISNLYTYAKEWQKAKEFGLWAQVRLANIKNLVAMASFHTSQGHVYNYFKEYEQSGFHYGLALKGYLKKGNAIHTAVGYHNVARTYQKTERFPEAIEHFLKSIEWSEKLGVDYNELGKLHTQMCLVQAYLGNDQINEAKDLYASLNTEILPDYMQDLYQQVTAELQAYSAR